MEYHSVDINFAAEEERKIFITILGKLYIPVDADAEKLRKVYELVAQAIEDKVAIDAVSRNALNKIEVSLGKIVGDLAEAAREETMIVGSVASDETDAGTETEEEEGGRAVGKAAAPREEGESEAEGSVATGKQGGEVAEGEGEGDVTIRPAGGEAPGTEDEDEL